MAARASTAQVLGRVTLVTGPEEFLNERTVRQVREATLAQAPDAEFSETVGGDLTPSSMGELSAPSLFSATRCVVVRALEAVPAEAIDGLLDYAKAPSDDVALVLLHSGGQKGSGTLTKLRKLDTVDEVKSAALKPSEFPRFVQAEARALGARMDDEAASFLVQAVGQDLRALVAGVDQLVNDFPGQPLDTERVRRYFGGRAEAKSFAVADAAFTGRRAQALEELRWALDGGTAPVLITSAFAGGARGLARYVSAPRGMREADLAREVGVPPWKLRTLRDQSRAWSREGLAAAINAVAQADADIKGAAHDPAYTLERLVLTIAGLRERR